MSVFATLSGQLPGVLARVRYAGLTGVRAENTALRILLQFHHRSGPAWLRSADDRTRLDVLTVLAINRQRDAGPVALDPPEVTP